MARMLCRLLGVAFVIAGAAGFANPTLLGMHLTPVHNIVHILSGGVALYVGFLGSAEAVRGFCFIFGAVYAALGVLGFVAPGLVASMLGHQGDVSARALTPDNVVHLLLGGLFLFGALAERVTHGEPRPQLR